MWDGAMVADRMSRLKHVEEADLEEIGMKRLQQRQFLALVHAL